MPIVLYVTAALVVVFVASMLLAVAYRRVVPQNEVHSVQSTSRTVSFGKGMSGGNAYYAWPSWIPHFGVVTTVLPVSVFSLHLRNYDAYDCDRLPLLLDISAFFLIEDPAIAAQRVSSFEVLEDQLENILEGASRTILASRDIQEILSGRSEFGEAFTSEVRDQLIAWGVIPVKNIELLDIRDAPGSQVIANIMEKKKSEIERDSRTEVAKNIKIALIAETEATRESDIAKQEALQAVGIRTAEKEREIGVANENAKQVIAEQNRVTQEKNVEVARVQEVGRASIQKQTNIITAEEKAATDILHAEGDKQKTILAAEAHLETERRNAEGIQLNGAAKAEAEKLILLAPVDAQITLAKEIGSNSGYQSYLIKLEEIKALQVVGVAQAEALESADLKIIANGGTVESGMGSIGQILSAKGGTALASMLEGLAQTDAGQAVVNKLTS